MEKEIHFYSSMNYAFSAMGPQLYRGWEVTLEALQDGVPIIHTLQMGILTYSALIFDAGYRIFIYDEYGEFELTLGNCARTNREIRYEHNHFKMWANGEFTNLEKETNGPMA